MSRAQTATEYLIILAVVIIVAIVVMSVLGVIPGMGGDAGGRAALAQLQAEKIGVQSYSVTPNGTFVFVRNNHYEMIRIVNVSVNDIPCARTNPSLPFSLDVGAQRTLFCADANESNVGDLYDYSLQITWVEVSSGGRYTINYRASMVGRVAEAPEGGIPETGGGSGSGEGADPGTGSGVFPFGLNEAQTDCFFAANKTGCEDYYVVGGCDGGLGVTVLDTITGLCFVRNFSVINNGGTLNWTNAINYCDNLVLCTDGSFQGDHTTQGDCSGHGGTLNDDWYLPTRQELLRIVDYGIDYDNRPLVVGGNNKFQEVLANWYWTSSLRTSSAAWIVVFIEGGVVSNPVGFHERAACVSRNTG